MENKCFIYFNYYWPWRVGVQFNLGDVPLLKNCIVLSRTRQFALSAANLFNSKSSSFLEQFIPNMKFYVTETEKS